MIEEVLAENENWIMQQPGVTGCGLSSTLGAINVYTNLMPAATRKEIIQRLAGHQVVFVETGRIVKQGE